jgi:hypothetical protein
MPQDATTVATIAALQRTANALADHLFFGCTIMAGARAATLLDVLIPKGVVVEEEPMTTVDVYLAALRRLGTVKPHPPL